MTVEERVNALEGDFKLIKGEMRQSLIDVRDFLITMKIPSLTDETILAQKQETETSKDSKDEGEPEAPTPPQAQPPQPEAQKPPEPVADEQAEGPKGWQPPEENEKPFAPPPRPEESQRPQSWDQPAAPPVAPFLPFPEMAIPQPAPQPFPRPEDFQPPRDHLPKAAVPEKAPSFPQVRQEERPYVPAQTGREERSYVTPQPKPEERPDVSFQPRQQEKLGEMNASNVVSERKEDNEAIKENDMEKQDETPVGKRDEQSWESKGVGGNVAPASQINMLANLARWVSVAKAQIGTEQLSVFLDLYGTAGPMPSALKDIILRLGQVVGQQSGQESNADVWSRLTLELHGILAGGGVPELIAHIDETKETLEKENAEESALSEDDEIEAEPEPPAMFKIVLPTGNGSHREYALNLGPEVSGNGAKSGNGRRPKA